MPARRRRPPHPSALTDFPPLRILRSIILLQLAYYAIAFTLILFTCVVAGQSFRAELVLDWRSVRGDNTLGYLLGGCWVCGAVFAVIVLLFLVNRSKLIPDFTLTLHFLHLLATSLYTRRIPSNLLWWALQCFSAGIMTSLGVWACRYREMQPISFGGKPQVAKAVGDDHVRGRDGSGRNVNGGPSYEMVGMGDANGEVV